MLVHPPERSNGLIASRLFGSLGQGDPAKGRRRGVRSTSCTRSFGLSAAVDSGVVWLSLSGCDGRWVID